MIGVTFFGLVFNSQMGNTFKTMEHYKFWYEKWNSYRHNLKWRRIRREGEELLSLHLYWSILLNICSIVFEQKLQFGQSINPNLSFMTVLTLPVKTQQQFNASNWETNFGWDQSDKQMMGIQYRINKIQML